MRIEADRECSSGAGMCARTAPTVFDQDSNDGRVVVLREQPPSELADAVEAAVDLCPSGALSLRRD